MHCVVDAVRGHSYDESWMHDMLRPWQIIPFFSTYSSILKPFKFAITGIPIESRIIPFFTTYYSQLWSAKCWRLEHFRRMMSTTFTYPYEAIWSHEHEQKADMHDCMCWCEAVHVVGASDISTWQHDVQWCKAFQGLYLELEVGSWYTLM